MMPPLEVSTTPCPTHLVPPIGDEVQPPPSSDKPVVGVTAALQRLHDWAQAQAPGCDFTGDHPIALARAALFAAQGAEPVGVLSVSKFRGHLENHSFDYTGSLPDGTYLLYTAPHPGTEMKP